VTAWSHKLRTDIYRVPCNMPSYESRHHKAITTVAATSTTIAATIRQIEEMQKLCIQKTTHPMHGHFKYITTASTFCEVFKQFRKLSVELNGWNATCVPLRQ